MIQLDAPVEDLVGIDREDTPAWIIERARLQAEAKAVEAKGAKIETYSPVGGVEIPAKIFPVPTDCVGWLPAAEKIFRVIGSAEPKRIFYRGTGAEGGIVEVIAGTLTPVTPERFASLIEEFGHRVAKREATKDENGKEVVRWRNAKMGFTNAKGLMDSTAARCYLPRIRQVSTVPIITPEGEVLGPGWHPCGSFVTSAVSVSSIPLDTAKNALLDLLSDFAFAAPSDKSRAFASFLSPALRAGGWIEDDFPLDVAEADQSQSGKTYRQKVAIAIYGGDPSPITIAEGGVGSLDESISAELIKGNPFVILENVRGKIASQVFESAIRGHGKVACRALRTCATVETGIFNWYLSTNGADLTRDLANRSIITRIKKRPRSKPFRKYPEGELIQHVKANQAFYLGCVFAILKEWAKRGRPRTEDNRHDFRGWCQSLDFILTRIIGLPALLDGHESEQQRVGNPDLQWLRAIALAPGRKRLEGPASASELAELAEDEGIEWPSASRERDGAIRVGRIMAKLFKDSEGEPIIVDGFTITRTLQEYQDDGGRWKTRSKYTFTVQ